MRSSSKDFKKKSKPPSLLPQKTSASKNLFDLKAKLNAQRQLMKTTTGKRFRESQKVKAQSISIQTSLPKQKGSLTKLPKPTANTKTQNKTMSLSSISGAMSSIDLSSSQHLQQFGWKQEENNRQIRQFLERIKLSKYVDDLIYAGFDDLDTLIQIDTETLNSLRMKGSHQRVLQKQIKKIRQQRGKSIKNTSNFYSTNSFSIITNRNRPQTQISHRQQAQSNRYSKKLQSKNKKTFQEQKPQINSSSFLYCAGGKNFNTIVKETNNIQRKACCLCFKVTYSSLRYGNYYYCSEQCIDIQKSKLKSRNIKTANTTLNTSNISKDNQSPPRPKFQSKQRKISKQKQSQDLISSFSSINLSSSFLRQYK